ncbi:programmed cell death protein 2 [Ricinus communis]|nr:programmed cell death protein 2 [Ricinus communis]XP_015582377.2 programmed cell death protein 2 [Ricinus communis]XP_015582378.2 programmed cell death protein 2 [Ricinus communis]
MLEQMEEESVESLKGLHIFHDDDDGDDDDDVKDEQEMVIEEDDDEDDEEQEPVTLGFVEKPRNCWSLSRQLFPSKAGGVPAWMDPINLPSGKSNLCDICGDPLQFLLQVYAPVSGKESTFHRTIFVFMCPSMSCLLRDQHEQWKRKPEKPSRSVKVFRCQLPRCNPFYSSEPSMHNGTDKPSTSGAMLCKWCGTWKGDKLCSKCKSARYCSQKHQVMHWCAGHKIDCQLESLSCSLVDPNSSNDEIALEERNKFASNIVWPEYEVINEDESEFDDEISDSNGHDNSLISKNKADDTLKLFNSFEGDSDRKCLAAFQNRIAKAPEQVLRYCRNASAKPIWPMSSGQPSKADIPNCYHCGGPLIFEFQVLPQLLYYFGVKNDADSLDWATIAVYTCGESCESSVSYKEEFAWVQLYSQSATCS